MRIPRNVVIIGALAVVVVLFLFSLFYRAIPQPIIEIRGETLWEITIFPGLPEALGTLPIRNTLEGVRSSDFYCPGSIVALDVDNKHSIGATVPATLPAYFINSSAYAASDDVTVRVIARYAKENVLMSGWLLGEDKLRGQIALAEVGLGKGRVVLFGFRPQHRGQAWATLPLIWNALSSATSTSTE